MTRFYGASWMDGCYLYVDYTITGQSISGNYSDISYTFGIHFGAYYFNSYNHYVGLSASVGSGSTAWSYSPYLAWPHGGTYRDYAYHSGTYRIYHDVNGNATANVSGHVNPSDFGGGGTRYVSGTIILPKITRVPSAPSKPVISNIMTDSVYVTFTDGASPGLTIDSRQIGYGLSSTSPQYTISSDGSTTVTGLSPAKVYYFWARTHNSVGWSAWSAVANARTIAGAFVNIDTVWNEAVPYVNVNGVWKIARPWVRIGGVWKESA